MEEARRGCEHASFPSCAANLTRNHTGRVKYENNREWGKEREREREDERKVCKEAE